MTNHERGMWLVGLKPGDEVYIPGQYRSVGTIATVARRTPSGRIVAGPYTFGADGYQWGAMGWSRARVEPVTDDVRDAVERARLVGELKYIAGSPETLNRISLATLRAAVPLLKPERAATE